MVPEVEQTCAWKQDQCRINGRKKGIRMAPDAPGMRFYRLQGALVSFVCEIMIRVLPLSSFEFVLILT